jgi:hypothetical protein
VMRGRQAVPVLLGRHDDVQLTARVQHRAGKGGVLLHVPAGEDGGELNPSDLRMVAGGS